MCNSSNIFRNNITSTLYKSKCFRSQGKVYAGTRRCSVIYERFKYYLIGDTNARFAETVPIYLEVESPDIDPDQDIKAIKPPIHAPVTFAEIAPWLGGGLLLVLIVILVIYILKKRKKEEPIFKIRSKPALPPHREAIEKLEKLRLKKLWQSGKLKSYHTELTDIIRYYIERRFSILALEMTTDEIMDKLKLQNINDLAYKKLFNTLVLADLVKFAKEQPLPIENDTSLNNCTDFVNETKPVPQPVMADEKKNEELVPKEINDK